MRIALIFYDHYILRFCSVRTFRLVCKPIRLGITSDVHNQLVENVHAKVWIGLIPFDRNRSWSYDIENSGKIGMVKRIASTLRKMIRSLSN